MHTKVLYRATFILCILLILYLIVFVILQIHFIVSSDDIGKARGLFPQELHPFATFVEPGHSAVLDMAILSLCCEHSLNSVGSYAWWAAFLREKRRLAAAGWTGDRLNDPRQLKREEVRNIVYINLLNS